MKTVSLRVQGVPVFDMNDVRMARRYSDTWTHFHEFGILPDGVKYGKCGAERFPAFPWVPSPRKLTVESNEESIQVCATKNASNTSSTPFAETIPPASGVSSKLQNGTSDALKVGPGLSVIARPVNLTCYYKTRLLTSE